MEYKIREHFITFLTRGRTQGFDSERRSYDRLKLIELTRYIFFNSNEFQVPFDLTSVGLNSFQSSSNSCTCIYKIMTYVGHICSSPKEKLAQYIRRTCSR
jgi:hypothetical protein